MDWFMGDGTYQEPQWMSETIEGAQETSRHRMSGVCIDSADWPNDYIRFDYCSSQSDITFFSS